MSLSSCLEEMLLHSFEQVGNSTASPHSKDTLKYIQELGGSMESTTMPMLPIDSSSANTRSNLLS